MVTVCAPLATTSADAAPNSVLPPLEFDVSHEETQFLDTLYLCELNDEDHFSWGRAMSLEFAKSFTWVLILFFRRSDTARVHGGNNPSYCKIMEICRIWSWSRQSFSNDITFCKLQKFESCKEWSPKVVTSLFLDIRCQRCLVEQSS